MNLNPKWKPLIRLIRSEFEIPEEIELLAGGGEVRIVACCSLISKRIRAEYERQFQGARSHAHLFKAPVIKRVSLIGGILTERPLLDESSFCYRWEADGIAVAAASTEINPLFQAHAHRLVRITTAYCQSYGLFCKKNAPNRHFEHLKPLRYILHAS